MPLTVTIFLETQIRYARTVELLPVYCPKDLVVRTVVSGGSWLHSNYSKESRSLRICHQILLVCFAYVLQLH